MLKHKTIIALLWVIWAMSMSVFMFIRILEPSSISDIIAGKFDGMIIGEGSLLFMTFWWFISWILAYLSLALKTSASRWMNITLGVIACVAMIAGFVTRMTSGHSVAMLIDYFLAAVIALLIVLHAWRLKREETV